MAESMIRIPEARAINAINSQLQDGDVTRS
jgi:hypothetical protein